MNSAAISFLESSGLSTALAAGHTFAQTPPWSLKPIRRHRAGPRTKFPTAKVDEPNCQTRRDPELRQCQLYASKPPTRLATALVCRQTSRQSKLVQPPG
jgi:hypothetical protein